MPAAMTVRWRPERWRVTVAERKAMVSALIRLTDAAWFVPIKQERTPEQQARVEEFSTAVIEARKLLRDLGERHYTRKAEC